MSMTEDDLVRASFAVVGKRLEAIEKGVRETKSTAIAALRRPQADRPPTGQVLVKSMAAMVRAYAAGLGMDAYCRGLGPVGERLAEIARDPMLVMKATTNPAMASVPSWAGDLVGAASLVPLQIVAPNSAWSALKARPGVVSVDFSGFQAALIPARASSGDMAGAFVAEGNAIPVQRTTFARQTLAPSKLGVITIFSKEMARTSTFEATVRTIVAADTTQVLDGVMLGSAAASGAQPAGLLNGVAPIAPSAATVKSEAVAADLGALAGAIPAASDLVFVARPETVTRAVLTNPGAASLTWIASAAAGAKQVVALDAASLALGSGDFVFDTTEETTLVTDSAPVGTDLIAGHPVQSLYQIACVGLRMLADCGWAMRGPGRIAHIDAIAW
jgi:hypothetical protein